VLPRFPKHDGSICRPVSFTAKIQADIIPVEGFRVHSQRKMKTTFDQNGSEGCQREA
jgi:hypothetical protein